mgnify:CR=1 FL=1
MCSVHRVIGSQNMAYQPTLDVIDCRIGQQPGVHTGIMTASAGVSLGRLLLALDRTVAQLITAPAGLDAVVSSAALLDVDDDGVERIVHAWKIAGASSTEGAAR